MKSHFFIDEVVLTEIFRTDTEDMAFKIAFTHYEEPFARHFKNYANLSIKNERGTLYQISFALLVKGIKEGVICAPFEGTLFNYLVEIGKRIIGQL